MQDIEPSSWRAKRRTSCLAIKYMLSLVLVGMLILLLIALFKGDDSIDLHRQYQEYTETFPDSIDLNLSLPLLRSGKLISVDSFTAGKLVILSFLSPTCYQCLQTLPKWETVNQDIAQSGAVELVFITTGPSRRYTAALLRRNEDFKDFIFPVFFDSTNTVVEVNGIPELPSTVLLDPDRRVQLAGSPVLRPEVFEMYQDKISEIVDRI